MSRYRVLRRSLRVDGVLRDPGDTFSADLPREESWVRAGLLEVVPDEAPKKQRRKRVRKSAPAQEPDEAEQVG